MSKKIKFMFFLLPYFVLKLPIFFSTGMLERRISQQDKEDEEKTTLSRKSSTNSTEEKEHSSHVDFKGFFRDTAAINRSIEPYCVL